MILPLPLGAIEVVEVYVEHEEPLLYLAKNTRGELFIAVLVEDGDEEQVWHFAPVSKRRIEDVRAGLIDLRDAFVRVEHGMVIALHRERTEGGYQRTDLVKAEALTEDTLPKPGKRLKVLDSIVTLPNTREIATAQRRVVAALRFIPRRREEKEVEVMPFAHVLYGVQGSLDAIGQDLAAKQRAKLPRGQRTRKARGADQPDPRQATKFKAADRFAASFGIELHSAEPADYFTGESPAADAMEKLVSLLEVVGDEKALIERLSEFKGTPAAGRLHTLLTGIGPDVVELQVDWASPKPGKGGCVSVTNEQASSGVATITRMRPDEPVEHWVTGYFSEVGDAPATFHFFEDAPKPRHFSGKVDEKARGQVPDVQIRVTKYRVRIIETVERNFEGDVRPKHRLMEILRSNDLEPLLVAEPEDESAEGEPYPESLLLPGSILLSRTLLLPMIPDLGEVDAPQELPPSFSWPSFTTE
ncbi:MAG: hypothetical protein Q8P41_15370 [Pseudomonadota bacterium]|nr:hypothetical protein [Pseudomonadota bacterium]